ncbi:MAG TPA: hypothetical protein ENG87_02365 [Candidatus Pacearchaeota archaeon]|nr:hypothetical protein BMS3Abin17_00279 [archaeon BMS3Abin17]HDK42199.1 hypothetical protein [Candidatus Pacearchaeota archaeon]HDZ60360.1 hypothetical protein [Candidatus Pacearchaeota archaeon]
MNEKYNVKEKGLGDLVKRMTELSISIYDSQHNYPNSEHRAPSLKKDEEEYNVITEELNERGKKYDKAVGISGLFRPLGK